MPAKRPRLADRPLISRLMGPAETKNVAEAQEALAEQFIEGINQVIPMDKDRINVDQFKKFVLSFPRLFIEKQHYNKTVVPREVDIRAMGINIATLIENSRVLPAIEDQPAENPAVFEENETAEEPEPEPEEPHEEPKTRRKSSLSVI